MILSQPTRSEQAFGEVEGFLKRLCVDVQFVGNWLDDDMQGAEVLLTI